MLFNLKQSIYNMLEAKCSMTYKVKLDLDPRNRADVCLQFYIRKYFFRLLVVYILKFLIIYLNVYITISDTII